MVIWLGRVPEEVSHEEGVPSALAISESDMARTSEETAMSANTKNEIQATMRALVPIRYFTNF